ncbi:hypothetical protein ACFWP2_28975 [Kitasatospora sp. NPDC058444]|uniref:hypothetical protein n=1 Tax=Kitasatospora sp. NPDC058444 TaxID=3346504 RepID=UPI00364AFEA9
MIEAVAYCPHCGMPLDAGPAPGGETEWHRWWKNRAPRDRQEVPFPPRRADVLAHDGTVVEIHRKSISPDEIAGRERHYPQMVWIVDARGPHQEGRLVLGLQSLIVGFRWRSPRTTFATSRRAVYFDLGDSPQPNQHVLLAATGADAARGRGTGTLVTATAMHAWIAHGVPLTAWNPPTDIPHIRLV